MTCHTNRALAPTSLFPNDNIPAAHRCPLHRVCTSCSDFPFLVLAVPFRSVIPYDPDEPQSETKGGGEVLRNAAQVDNQQEEEQDEEDEPFDITDVRARKSRAGHTQGTRARVRACVFLERGYQSVCWGMTEARVDPSRAQFSRSGDLRGCSKCAVFLLTDSRGDAWPCVLRGGFSSGGSGVADAPRLST